MTFRSLLAAISLAGILAAAAHPAAADPIKFPPYPHEHGNRMTFSFPGDIRIANRDGSNPAHLTAHVARDTFRLIAFTSQPHGQRGSGSRPPAR